MEQLTQAQHKAAEALYKQSAPGGGTGPAAGDAGGGESSSSSSAGPGAAQGDVIDAEVVDEK